MPKLVVPSPSTIQPTASAFVPPLAEAMAPPYIPWKSFDGFVGTLKSTHPPDVIDNGVMPTSMAGGLRRQIKHALKFLGLTNEVGKVSTGFAELISAHGTPQWPTAVKEHVIPAYEAIIGSLPIENATSAQLDAKFKDKGVTAGQMLDKTTRFYLHALKAAEIKYSGYWSIRNENGPRKKSTSQKSNTGKKIESLDSGESPPAHHPKKDDAKLIEFPLHFGDKATGKICVPPNMDENDMALFDATAAVVKAYCARKKSTDK